MIETDAMTLAPGESRYLFTQVIPDNVANRQIRYRSSNTNVATVGNNGRITALRPGVAVITASGQSSLAEKSCVVTVSSGETASGRVQGTGVLLDESGAPVPQASLTLQGQDSRSFSPTDKGGSASPTRSWPPGTIS